MYFISLYKHNNLGGGFIIVEGLGIRGLCLNSSSAWFQFSRVCEQVAYQPQASRCITFSIIALSKPFGTSKATVRTGPDFQASRSAVGTHQPVWKAF